MYIVCSLTYTENGVKCVLQPLLSTVYSICSVKSVLQGYNERKVNCSCVYSAYILKPVLSGRNL